ncbi:MAG: transglycosylase SLT domain-containing protein [Bacteriovoracia bacterium]
MIPKYLLLGLFALLFLTSSDPYFSGDLFKDKMPSTDEANVREMTWMSSEAFRPYLEDHDNRVSEAFKISPYYYASVNFWFMIYTQFESSSVVIHDKSNLGLIYKVLDFSSLHKKKLPRNTLYILQRELADEKLESLKGELAELIRDPFSLTPSAKRIYQTLSYAKVDLPLKKEDRVAFFKSLKKNIRTQTGQKNFIREGVVRSLPYRPFLEKYFSSRKLPLELIAIPFLESSFNPRAHSKVNALGVWQFMPLIASYFVPKRTNHYDYRSNVGVASVAAGFLMSENFQIMKSWDLAVTAYNSGTKHLLKTKRELASNDVDLEAIIKHSDSEHFGFASKNFYSEFLALAHTLAYREELFDQLHEHDRQDVNQDLKFYLAKCPLKLSKVLDERLLDDVKFHNHQLSAKLSQIPKGFILTSKSTLPAGRFLEVPFEKLVKVRPRDWSDLLKRQSCSTR